MLCHYNAPRKRRACLMLQMRQFMTLKGPSYYKIIICEDTMPTFHWWGTFSTVMSFHFSPVHICWLSILYTGMKLVIFTAQCTMAILSAESTWLDRSNRFSEHRPVLHCVINGFQHLENIRVLLPETLPENLDFAVFDFSCCQPTVTVTNSS